MLILARLILPKGEDGFPAAPRAARALIAMQAIGNVQKMPSQGERRALEKTRD